MVKDGQSASNEEKLKTAKKASVSSGRKSAPKTTLKPDKKSVQAATKVAAGASGKAQAKKPVVDTSEVVRAEGKKEGPSKATANAAKRKRSKNPVKPNYALEARKGMKVLGVYKEEFEPVIRIYGQLRHQYDQLTERFEKSDFNYSEETAQGSKKHPIVTTLESLRKDILSYASQLGLTPAGLKRINDESMKPKRTSSLGDTLRKLSGSA